MTLESQVFRPTKKYWINTSLSFLFLAVILLIIGYGAGAWNFLDRFPNWFFVLASVLLFAGCLWGLLTIWQRLHTNLEFSESILNGHTGWKPFSYLWSEIVWITEYEDTENNGKTPYLIITTQDRTREFNLIGFDKTAVWQAIETYAPLEILEPAAYKKLDAYQLFQQKQDFNQQQVRNKLPLTVSTSFFLRLFFIVGILFWTFCAIILRQEGFLPIIILTCFSLLFACFALALQVQLRVDQEGLVVKKLWGTYQLPWSEILSIEVYSNEISLAFHGKKKKIVVPAPSLWQGEQKEDFKLFLNQQIAENHIELIKR